MLHVLAALLPGIALYVWLLAPAVLAQIGIATVTALTAARPERGGVIWNF